MTDCIGQDDENKKGTTLVLKTISKEGASRNVKECAQNCANIHSILWPCAIVAREQIFHAEKMENVWKTKKCRRAIDDLWWSCMRQHVRPALPWRWLARCNTPVNHGSKPLLAEMAREWEDMQSMEVHGMKHFEELKCGYKMSQGYQLIGV